MITSDHNPMDIEHKKMEFDMAKDGTIGLESAFCACFTIRKVVEKLTSGKIVLISKVILLKRVP
jgi:dihydroorotase